MTKAHRGAGLALVLAAAGTLALAIAGASAQTPSPPDIKFAPDQDTSLKDPDNPIKRFHVDLARVEHEFPLSRQDRMKITPENIAVLPQERVDQIYGRLTAGPIPDGKYAGGLFFARGDTPTASGDLNTRLGEILEGPDGKLTNLKVELLEKFGAHLWKGKKFFRDERVLRNMIQSSLLLRPLIDNVDSVMEESVPNTGRFAGLFPERQVWLLFPAKLYCGQSLLDTRRESVIVDYHFSDDIDGYRPRPDSLADRGGLRIRDEIRMVRPGFYLGRAYANRMFLLNFTLYNEELADAGAADFLAGRDIAEDCWPASQQIRGAAR